MTLAVGTAIVVLPLRPEVAPAALIYFGGNAEDVSQDIPDLADAFPDRAIYALHYPGYGGSSGSPSQKAIFAASLALFDRVHAEHQNVVVVGRSLRSGAPFWIASQTPTPHLTLLPTSPLPPHLAPEPS